MILKYIKKFICFIIIVLLLYNILKNTISKTNIEHRDFHEIFNSNEINSRNICCGTDWMKALPPVKYHDLYAVVPDINRYSAHNVLTFITSNPDLINRVKEYENFSKCNNLNIPSTQNSHFVATKASSKYITWSSSVGLSPMYVGYRPDDVNVDVTWKNDYKRYKEFYLDQHKALLTTNKKMNATYILGTVIILQHFDDGNIFHQLKNSGILFYLLSQSQILKNVSVIMTSKSTLKSSQLWIEAAAAQLINLIDISNYTDRTLLFDDIYKIESASFRNNIIFSDFFTLNQNPVPEMLALRNALISRLPSAKKHVLLLYRHPRYLVDSNTKAFNTIVEEMCKMGLNIKVANFENTSPREQQTLFRNAAVVVAVHGSELTNLIYLDPASIIIEITLRYGWCCDPIPLKNQMSYAEPCTANCRAYHKWDFANLAHSMDLKYFYFDPIYADPPHASNPIARNEVHVNSKDLALIVCTALVIADTEFSGFQNFKSEKNSYF